MFDPRLVIVKTVSSPLEQFEVLDLFSAPCVYGFSNVFIYLFFVVTVMQFW
jgi:hypothetical protein